MSENEIVCCIMIVLAAAMAFLAGWLNGVIYQMKKQKKDVENNDVGKDT